MKKQPKGAHEPGPSPSPARGAASVAVLIDSSSLGLFGSAPVALPASGRLDFGHGSGASGTWRAVSWPEPSGEATEYRFFALCGVDSITQLDSERTRIVPAGAGTPVPFPGIGKIEIDVAAMVDCLRGSPQRAADVFDVLQDAFAAAPAPNGDRTRDLAYSLLRATSPRDGFIEILARPECDGLLIQGWSFGLGPGVRSIYVEQGGLTRCEAVVGAFPRNDLPEAAHGFVAFFKELRGERDHGVERIYVRTDAGYGHLDIVDSPTRFEPRDAVTHLRHMLPQLAGDVADLRALKRVTRPRFEGADTAQALSAPVRVAMDKALYVAGTGFLLSGWMLDPRRLVRLALFKSTANFYFRANDAWHRTPRPDVSDGFRADPAFEPYLRGDDQHGFLVFVPRVEPVEPDENFYLELVLEDETCAFLPVLPDRHAAAQTVRDILGSINIEDPSFDLVVERHLGPVVGAAFSERPPASPALPRVPLGRPLTAPEVSIVVPIEDDGADLDVNLARLSGDPDLDTAEFLFVAPRSANDGLARRLARQMDFYGLSGSLVLSAEAIGYFEALDLGAREARADLLLFLSHLVFPDGPGWLSTLVTELKRQPYSAAISPTLLYEDHSIRYAGAAPNAVSGVEGAAAPSLAGYPSHWLDGDETSAAESMAAECCLISRDRYVAADGFSREFAGADFNAADLSLRLGEAGLACLWAPGVTMYALDADAAPEPQDYWIKPARRIDAWRFAAKWTTDAPQPGSGERAP